MHSDIMWQQVDALFDYYDLDKSGFVCFNEFLHGLRVCIELVLYVMAG